MPDSETRVEAQKVWEPQRQREMQLLEARPLRNQRNRARELLKGWSRLRARAPGSILSAPARPLPYRPTNGHFLPHSQPIPTLHEE